MDTYFTCLYVINMLIDSFILQACYDIRESSVLWETLAVADGDNQPVEWLSTHPAHETRAGYLDMIIPDFIEYRKKCNCDDLKGNLYCKTLTHQSGSIDVVLYCLLQIEI